MAHFGVSSSIAAVANAATRTLEATAAATVKDNGEILGLMIPSSPNTTCRNRPPSTGGRKMVRMIYLYLMTLEMPSVMFPYLLLYSVPMVVHAP